MTTTRDLKKAMKAAANGPDQFTPAQRKRISRAIDLLFAAADILEQVDGAEDLAAMVEDMADDLSNYV